MYKKIILYFILIFSIYLFGYKLGYTNYEFTSTLKIDSSYKIKLDNFLRTTYDSKSNFSSDKNYLLFLDKINFKINSYKNKYSSKEDFKLLLNYLSEGILNIKILVEKDNELDDFFCEITGNCNTSSGSSTSSSTSTSSGGRSCNINYGKTCQLGNRYYYSEKGNYDKYITGDQKRLLGTIRENSCPSVPNGEIFLFAQYKTDSQYLFSEVSKLSAGDNGYGIKSNYLTCASETLGKINCSGQCVSSLGPIDSSSSSSSSSSSGGGIIEKLQLSYHDTLTKTQKSSYYRDEILDFYSNGIGNTPDKIRACMENIGIPSTSCSISTNWVKPPNDWSYIGNNTWKNSGFKLSNIPVGTYRGYWKDISNNRESNIIELTIINQNKPEFLKTPNISYYGSKKLDLYYPTNVYNSNKVPVYLMLHGGAWYSGDKGDVDSSIVDFGKYFTKNGVAYVPMSYTLATSSKSSYDLVYKEISCALNWINFNKDKYNFDTNNINLLGWSAGGHLVLQYSLNQNFYTTNDCSWGNNIINLSQIVSVAGPSDLTKDFSNTEAGNLNPYLEYFLGAKKGTDLFNQRVYSNSPIKFVNKDNKNKKYYIFHAKNDGIVNYQEHAVPFYNLLKNNNYNVILDTGFDNHNALSIPEVSIKKVLNQ